MKTFDSTTGSTPVRLTVKPTTCAQNWGSTFAKAGWRTFSRAVRPNAAEHSMILKRGLHAVCFSQSAEVPFEQTVQMPTLVAPELCALFVQSGLAAPA